MKHFRQLIIFFICSCILLSGCGKNPGKEKLELWNETIIPLPNAIISVSDIRIDNGNSICVLGTNDHCSFCQWKSGNLGKDWYLIYDYSNVIQPEIVDYELIEFDGSFLNGDTIGVKINCFKDSNSWNYSSLYYLIESGERIESIKYDFNKVSTLNNNHIFKLNSLNNGEMLVEDMEGILYRIGEQNNLSSVNKMFSLPYVYGLKEDTIYLINKKETSIINPSERDNENAFNVLKEVFSKIDITNTMIGVSESGSRKYYIVSSDGIWTSDNKKAYQIIDGEHSELGNGIYIKDVIVDVENNIFVLANSSDGPILLRYNKSYEPTVIDDELKVFVLKDGNDNYDVIEKIVNNYCRENKNVDIIIETGMDDSYYNLSDVEKKLNSMILAGNGPDIIFFDGLEPEKYAEKGLLDDISKEIFVNPSELLVGNNKESIDSEIYFFPASFSCMAMCSTKNDYVQNGEFEAFARNIKGHVLPSFDRAYVIGILYREYFDESKLKETNDYDTYLKQFFVFLKQIMNVYKGNATDDMYVNLNLDSLSISTMDTFSMLALDNRSDVALDYIRSFSSLQKIYNQIDNEGLSLNIFEKNGEKMYIPELNVGINKQSGNKEIAKRFVKYVFSEEGQNTIARCDRFPVKRDAFVKKLNTVKGDYIYSLGYSYELKPFTKTEQNKIIKDFNNMNIAATEQCELMEIVLKGAEVYLNEETDIDEAVALLSEKIKIYFAE